jgi:ribosome biogenesis SPOUT family RNA methylase Rps3
MSESKQTVVDWLSKELMNVEPNTFGWDKLIEQAKEMDKQRIMDARQSGINAAINGKSISNIDYYNETYGGDTK